MVELVAAHGNHQAAVLPFMRQAVAAALVLLARQVFQQHQGVQAETELHHLIQDLLLHTQAVVVAV
jgi:hypothetical protein